MRQTENVNNNNCGVGEQWRMIPLNQQKPDDGQT